jgi:hypothetical protein
VNKTKWLDAAQIFDQWRIVPRITLFGYAFWVVHVIDKALSWYQTLPMAERTIEATGLTTAIISVITGLFPWVYKIYSDAATDWGYQPSRTSISSTTTEVTK